jgi:hypothetical protein
MNAAIDPLAHATNPVRREQRLSGLLPVISRNQTWSAFGRIHKKSDLVWLRHGVFEYQPSCPLNTWLLQVTSGTSTPWEQAPHECDPQGCSGIGDELVLEPGDREGACADADAADAAH